MGKALFYFLCMTTFDGIQSDRFVVENSEQCYVPGAKYVYVQTYDTRKEFDMARLWAICNDRCKHLARIKR